MYVWLDALTNYLTCLGYPKSLEENETCNIVHIIGKDITKFHCIYWPAFLIGAGFNLPKHVLSHGHWLKDNVRFPLIKLN